MSTSYFLFWIILIKYLLHLLHYLHDMFCKYWYVFSGSSCKTPRKLVKKRLLRNVNSLTPRCKLFYNEYKKAKRQNGYNYRAKRALAFSKETFLEELTKHMNPLTKSVLWMQVRLCTKNKKALNHTGFYKKYLFCLPSHH